jgi:5-methylcytosine-specific restriction endonuclease McrA
MAKLTNLKPRFGSMAPSLNALPPETDKPYVRTGTNQSWRAWYKTRRWQKLRMQVITRDRFTCKRCGKVEVKTSQLVCDHIKPHRGDEHLFWDMQNLQTLCADPCHNSVKAREESSMPAGVWY